MLDRTRFERELSELGLDEMQFPRRAALPHKTLLSSPVQRKMKFEIQTKNVVLRTGHTSPQPLKRKFGPLKSRFLHRGKIGAPRRLAILYLGPIFI